jgi:hypothetical protein
MKQTPKRRSIATTGSMSNRLQSALAFAAQLIDLAVQDANDIHGLINRSAELGSFPLPPANAIDLGGPSSHLCVNLLAQLALGACGNGLHASCRTSRPFGTPWRSAGESGPTSNRHRQSGAGRRSTCFKSRELRCLSFEYDVSGGPATFGWHRLLIYLVLVVETLVLGGWTTGSGTWMGQLRGRSTTSCPPVTYKMVGCGRLSSNSC